jgi:hypothetical protein
MDRLSIERIKPIRDCEIEGHKLLLLNESVATPDLAAVPEPLSGWVRDNNISMRYVDVQVDYTALSVGMSQYYTLVRPLDTYRMKLLCALHR